MFKVRVVTRVRLNKDRSISKVGYYHEGEWRTQSKETFAKRILDESLHCYTAGKYDKSGKPVIIDESMDLVEMLLDDDVEVAHMHVVTRKKSGVTTYYLRTDPDDVAEDNLTNLPEF